MKIDTLLTWINQNILLIMLVSGTLLSFIWLLQFRDRLRMTWYAALIFSILHTLIGLFSVKAFAFIETGGKNAGGMSLYGGVFFMPLIYLLGAKITKRKTADVVDIFTACMIVTVMLARVNCIFAGCCYGINIFGNSGLQWPARELEILFYLILLPIIAYRVKKNTMDGLAYPIYMISYGAFRFINEFLRYSDSRSIIHPAHIWSLISIAVGISIYAEKKSRKEKKRRKL